MFISFIPDSVLLLLGFFSEANMDYVSFIRNCTFPVWFLNNFIRYRKDAINKFYLQLVLSFLTFILGAGKIKETTRNKRYGKAQVHVWHNLFEIDSLHFCCIHLVIFIGNPIQMWQIPFIIPLNLFITKLSTSHLDFGTSDKYASSPFHRIS